MKLGDGYGSNATGCPIIVDDSIYVYGDTSIYKIDKISGEIKAQGSMAHSSSFGINPPTYADGMIFVGLSGGDIPVSYTHLLYVLDGSEMESFVWLMMFWNFSLPEQAGFICTMKCSQQEI